MRDKMERKKDAARQRKKALEDAHADNLRRKEDLDMEAAEKNAQATEVEMQVRLCPLWDRVRERADARVTAGLTGCGLRPDLPTHRSAACTRRCRSSSRRARRRSSASRTKSVRRRGPFLLSSQS